MLVVTKNKITTKNKINKAIDNNQVVPIVSDKVLNTMETLYTVTEGTNKEYTVAVESNGNAISNIITGEKDKVRVSDAYVDLNDNQGVELDNEGVTAYDIHTHGNEEMEGNQLLLGLAEPSEYDIEAFNTLVELGVHAPNEPNIVLGYRKETDYDGNVTTPRTMGFFTSEEDNVKVDYKTYTKAVEEINKKD